MPRKSQIRETESAPAAVAPPTDDLAARLELIARHAPALSRAGVTSFSYDPATGKIAATLGTPAPTPDSAPAGDSAPPPPPDPFGDPATYPSGRVPGFTMEDQ